MSSVVSGGFRAVSLMVSKSAQILFKRRGMKDQRKSANCSYKERISF